ncbi:MAG TPA: class I SAM-dependent methyltransferase [Candidatus Limnocylindrales bacterium]
MSGNARSRRSRRPASSGWDHLAGWYDGWVGPDGSRYHRAQALPLALDLLDLRPGERLLDVGAGQGVLAPHVRRAGALYVGIDASPRMIAFARRHHGRDGEFIVGDATRLDTAVVPRTGPFDAAVFMLSIQDMDPLEPVLESVAAILAPSARIVLVLTHPAFRVPRHSGWVADPGRGIASRRVDAYLRPMAVPLSGRPGTGSAPSTAFHRPLSTYVNLLSAEGFAIEAMVEQPDKLRTGPGTNAEIPLFLGLRASRRAPAGFASGATVRRCEAIGSRSWSTPAKAARRRSTSSRRRTAGDSR